MPKIFLVGMTQNQKENIKALTDPIYKHVDGLIFVDHGSTDGTRELLEERKGDGLIIDKKWTNSFDTSMNGILLEGNAKPGDWLVFRDSMERVSDTFAQKLEYLLSSFLVQGVRTIYNYGKIFAFQYHDGLFFVGSPHFGLQGAQGKAVDLKDYHDEEKKEWTWRLKDGSIGGRPADNKVDHEAKYYWCLGRSNHLLLGREEKLDEYQYLEAIRVQVRDVARVNGFDMTLEGLKEFMSWSVGPERGREEVRQAKIWINGCHILRNFYRKHIEKADWSEIEKNEKNWRLV